MWVIKSRRIRWTGHVASMGEMRNTYRVLAERAYLVDRGMDGMKILKLFLE
jgi:hypothetical protein